jgi:hypothetical protein
MVIQLQPQELDLLYRQVEAAYWACISDPENAYLQAEVPLPLPDLEIRPGQVKMVFPAGSVKVGQIEVHVELYAAGKWMGKYVSTLNASGEVIDDRLVFH